MANVSFAQIELTQLRYIIQQRGVGINRGIYCSPYSNLRFGIAISSVCLQSASVSYTVYCT